MGGGRSRGRGQEKEALRNLALEVRDRTLFDLSLFIEAGTFQPLYYSILIRHAFLTIAERHVGPREGLKFLRGLRFLLLRQLIRMVQLRLSISYLGVVSASS